MRERTVLIIDDNEALAEGLRLALEDLDYVAVVAPNGAVALAYLGCMTPDFIVYDVVMPELDGAAFARVLQTDRRLALVPRVAMSGLRAHPGLPDGEIVLCKPFELAELYRALSRSERQVEGHAAVG